MKIVLSAVVALLLIGCSDNSGTEKKEELVKKEVVVEAKAAPVEEKKSIVKTVVKKKETPKKLEKTKVVKKEVVKKKVLEKEVTPVVASVDGAKVFKKCASCHGMNAEKKALNKSAIIQGWNSQKITTAINGYKDGTYGNSMKGVMKPQVSNLSAEEVKAVADYISKL